MSKNMQRRLRELNKEADKTTRAAKKKGRGKAGGPAPAPPSPFDNKPDEVLIETVGFVAVVVIGLILVVGVGVFFGLRSIEDTLEANTRRALVGNGIRDVVAEASGTDVLLVGTVSEEDQIVLSQQVALSVEGVNSVATNIVWVPPNEAIDTVVLADPFDVTWVGNTVVVSGTLSNQSRVDQVVAVLDQQFTSVDAAGLIVAEELPPEDDWLAAALRVVDDMADAVAEGTVVVNSNDRIIVVGGEFETRRDRRTARDNVESILAGVPFAFSSGLTVEDAEVVTRERVEELQSNLDELIEDKVVEFEFDSAVLTEEGTTLLDEIIEALRTEPTVEVEIVGHTDDIGSPESNMELSLARAESVLAYMVAAGEDPVRFYVIGYGETRPIADNATDEGRARNRRIEFVALLEEN